MAIVLSAIPNLTVGNNLTVSISGHTIGNSLSFVLKVGGTTILSIAAFTVNSTTYTYTYNVSSVALYTDIYNANSGKSLTSAVQALVYETTSGGTPVSNANDYSNLVMNTNHRSTVASWTSTYTIGNTITTNISKTYTSFRSAIAYYIEGTLIKRVSGITGTSYVYTPSSTEITAMKNAMGGQSTGTLSINLETGYIIDTGTSYWGYRTYTGTANQTLESILTNGTQNFTVNSSGVTYTITRYNSTYVHRVELIHWNGTAEVIIMTKNSQTTSCAFSLAEMTTGATNNIYLRNTTGNTVRIRVRLTTFESNGTTQVGTAVNYTGDGTTTGVATFDTALIRPTFTSYAVANSLSGITGNVLHWVQNKSTGTVTITGAAGSNSSTISTYTAVIGGVATSHTASAISITVKNLTGSQAISVYVTDSRGNQSLAQATPGPLTFYAYSAPSVTSMLAYRSAFNDSNPKLNLTYQISVAGTNVPIIQWRITQLPGGTPTAYTTITNPTPSAGVYTLTASTVLGVRSYLYAFLVEFQIRDSITTSYSSAYATNLPQGTPIMHMEQGRVGINTTTPMGALDVVGDIYQNGALLPSMSSLLQKVYPVGALYTTNDGTTNPSNAALLGFGTWSLVAQGTYPMSAGASYAVGTTGGSVTHGHTSPPHGHVLSDTGQAKLHHGGGVLHAREITTASWERNLAITISGTTGTGAQTTGIGLTGETDQTTALVNDATQSTTFRPPYIAVFIWRRTA